MLRPLYSWQHGWRSDIPDDCPLRTALKWWLQVLSAHITELRSWKHTPDETVYLYADASAEPAHVAAVLFTNDGTVFSDWQPTEEFMEIFTPRSDHQIMGLEMVAIALGISTFKDYLRDKHVMLFSDNVGAEGAIKKGSAKCFDHCHIVHTIWLMLMRLNASVYVTRVPTEDNVADLPSRRSYSLLEKIGAKRLRPLLNRAFWSKEAWVPHQLQADCVSSQCVHASSISMKA